jgi:transcriptional regulator with XRE-family HTH domain
MNQEDLSLLIEGRRAAATGRGVQIRQAAGLSQAEVARLAGVTPAAVNRWERGVRTPREREAIGYGRALRRISEEMTLA